MSEMLDEAIRLKIIAALFRDRNFCMSAAEYLKPSYFDESPVENNLSKIAIDYWRKFKSTCTDFVFTESIKYLIESKKIKKEDIPIYAEFYAKIKKLDISDAGFVAETVVTWVKKQEYRKAIEEAVVKFIPKGNFEELEKEMKRIANITANADREPYSYFGDEEIEARCERRHRSLLGVERGIPTGIKKMDDVFPHNGFFKKELYNFLAPPKTGKCVTRDTVIFTEDGMCEIGDYIPLTLKDGGFQEVSIPILARNGIENSSHIYNDGFGKTKVVTLKNGIKIEGTPEHPLLVKKAGEEVWVKCSDLQIGDHVVCKGGCEVFGKFTTEFKEIFLNCDLFSESIPKYVLLGTRDTVVSYLEKFVNFDTIESSELVFRFEKFARQMQMCLLNLGYSSTLSKYGVFWKLFNFENIPKNNFFYSEIESIVDSENVTVDVTMPETHSFIANGIVSHNTQALSFFANMGALDGHNVAYFSGETSIEVLTDRIDSMNAEIEVKKIAAKYAEAKTSILACRPPKGNIYFFEYPTKRLTCSEIERQVKKLENKISDKIHMIVSDYTGTMKAEYNYNDKLAEEASIYEGLRALATIFDCPVLTASQINRLGSSKTIVTGADKAGTYEAIMVADYNISFSASVEDMKKAQLIIHFAECRNVERRTIRIATDYATGRFYKKFLEEVE